MLSVFVLAGLFGIQVSFADKESEANKYYLDAYNLYKLGKLDESLGILRKVVEINPDHAEAHFGMGSIYFRQNMFDDAVREFTKVTRIKPQYVEAYQRLWLAYKKLGMNDKAEEELMKYKKLIEDRMQAMGGGSPQVVKPVSPPQQEEKLQEKPRQEVSKPPEVTRPSETTDSETKVSGYQPLKTETKSAESVVVRPEAAPREPEKVSPSIVKSVPLAEEKRPVEQKPPVAVMPREESKLSLEGKSTTRLNSEYDAPYIKIDRKDPRYKNLFTPFSKMGSTWFQRPFKNFGYFKKPSAGKLIKGIICYVVVVQVWLCIVASLCIYFSKKGKQS